MNLKELEKELKRKAEYAREYYKKNKTKITARNRKRYEKIDKIRNYQIKKATEYRIQNAKSIKKYNKIYYIKNKSKKLKI